MGDVNVEFDLTDMSGISKYVSQIIADPRNINGRVLAYTEVLSMNEIWDVMARASEEQLHDIIAQCRKRLEASSLSLSDPSNIIDTANFNMGQYRISWCICGEYPGIWRLPWVPEFLGIVPEFPKGKSLEVFYEEVLG